MPPTVPASEPAARETRQPFFLSVRGETLDEVQGYWTALAVGASIVEPLAASPWSPGFGVLTDAFGVIWVIDVGHRQGCRVTG